MTNPGHDEPTLILTNPVTRPAARLIGRTLRAIAHILQELGIETKEGNQVWTPATISRILKRTG